MLQNKVPPPQGACHHSLDHKSPRVLVMAWCDIQTRYVLFLLSGESVSAQLLIHANGMRCETNGHAVCGSLLSFQVEFQCHCQHKPHYFQGKRDAENGSCQSTFWVKLCHPEDTLRNEGLQPTTPKLFLYPNLLQSMWVISWGDVGHNLFSLITWEGKTARSEISTTPL